MQTPYDAILNVGVRSWPTAAYREWQLSTHSEPSRLVNAEALASQKKRNLQF